MSHCLGILGNKDTEYALQISVGKIEQGTGERAKGEQTLDMGQPIPTTPSSGLDAIWTLAAARPADQ